MFRLRKMVVSMILMSALSFGCSPGYHSRRHSTAPSFGPIIAGLSRVEVEKSLGTPVMTIPRGETEYTNIYEYNREWSLKEVKRYDLMDLFTFGLGVYIVSPMDRYSGTKQLVAITYRITGLNYGDDRVIHIKDKMKGSPFDLAYIEEKDEVGQAEGVKERK